MPHESEIKIRKASYWAIVFLVGICTIFFYQTILFGKIPFPGDLLLSEYTPWRNTSYFGYAPGAVPNKGQYFDVIRELYPWKKLAIDEIKQGRWPLWNPYNFSGTPLLANYQTAVFYPLSIIYFLFPFVIGWAILVFLQPVLGTLFVYLFATEIGITAWGSVLAAIAFNFSYFASVWVEFNTVWHTLLWLPLILWVIERSIVKKTINIPRLAVLTFSLFSAITAGHPQDFLNMFLFFLFYTVVRLYTTKDLNNKQKALLGLSICGSIACAFGIAAPQWLPTVELFRSSARVSHDYTFIIQKVLLQPAQLVMFVSQDFFGNPATKSYFIADTYVDKTVSIGLVSLVLALLAAFGRSRRWHVSFFTIIAVLTFFLCVRSPLSELFYRFPIPIFSTGSPTRLLFLLAFALSLLAGYGFDIWRENHRRINRPLCIFGVLIATLWLMIFISSKTHIITFTPAQIRTMSRALLVTTTIFIGLVVTTFVRNKKYSQIILLSLVIVELFYAYNKFNPFVPRQFIYPENSLLTFLKEKSGLDRFWGYGTGRIEANIATQVRLYSPDGTDPLNLKFYNQFLQSSQDGNIARVFARNTRSDANIAPGYGETDLPQNLARLRILDALGVKYILDRVENPKDKDTYSQDRFTPIWNKDDWTVYINKHAAPRYFLTANIQYYQTLDEFEKKFFDTAFDPRSQVILPSGIQTSLSDLQPTSNALVKLITYTPTSVQFSVSTDAPQLLFLSDTYDKGWLAWIDNKPSPIYLTDFAFRGIHIPVGLHRVDLRYQPKQFTFGLRISLVTILLSFIFLLRATIIKKRSSQKA